MTEIQTQRVKVDAPARLHMGFVDLHGGLGRRFGSLGLCIDNLSTCLSVSDSHGISAEGPSAERAKKMAETLFETFNLEGGVHIEIHRAIGEHIGLGSGTQLSLAVARAISELKQLDVPIKHLARLLGRGDRSGIGMGAFRYGGFLVDGGRSDESSVPPIIAHIPFPDAWRVLLIFDNDRVGVHGSSEKHAFQTTEPMSEAVSQQLCRVLLMQVLPALAEQDCATFGKGITTIQNHIGDYFASWQGGRYCSERVAAVLDWVRQQSATGYGQSSWGPTGFAIFANETEAYQVMKLAKENWIELSGLEFMVCKARNTKAEVTHSSVEQTEHRQEV